VEAVKLYPAIDLKDGQCVRLVKGDLSQATVFNRDPAAQARTFAAAGFRRLHVVDLNGAVSGKPVNATAVEAILAATRLPVQLGGGIRNAAQVEGWLARGVDRVVIGTLALRDPALGRQLCRRFPGRIAIGIDARAGKVAVEGWTETSAVDALYLARQYEDAGAGAIIYTDIERDGVLTGVNVTATGRLADAVSTPVIASGGVAGQEDLVALAADGRIAGAIIGRALYDGRLDAAAALTLEAA
jgi:phosphoribosylformimino-5-aminoimidazole carboxamide ribotide isomerase